MFSKRNLEFFELSPGTVSKGKSFQKELIVKIKELCVMPKAS